MSQWRAYILKPKISSVVSIFHTHAYLSPDIWVAWSTRSCQVLLGVCPSLSLLSLGVFLIAVTENSSSDVIYHVDTRPPLAQILMSHLEWSYSRWPMHVVSRMSFSISFRSQGLWEHFPTASPQRLSLPPSSPIGSATGTAAGTDLGPATAAGSSPPATARQALALPGQLLRCSFDEHEMKSGFFTCS